MALCGGTTKDPKEADDEIQSTCEKVRKLVEDRTGKKYEMFKAVNYVSQVVAGVNYFVKVQISGDEFIHLRIYRDLQGQHSLSGVQEGVGKDEVVAYFEQN